jgi:hypothetical protein
MSDQPDEASEALAKAFPMSIPADRAMALAAVRAALPRSATVAMIVKRAGALLRLRELRTVRVGVSGSSSRWRVH